MVTHDYHRNLMFMSNRKTQNTSTKYGYHVLKINNVSNRSYQKVNLIKMALNQDSMKAYVTEIVRVN